MEQLTNLGTIRALCDKYGFSFAKGYGQHFLVNPGICPKICDVAGIGPNSDVLEIGPGFGTLTQEIARRARRVVSLEVDKRLLPVLDETLAGFTNAKIIPGDVMKADLTALLAEEFGGEASVCANLPYNITSPIIMALLEQRLPLAGITVMVQKEAAQRICAAPGTRASGAISYAVHYYARTVMQFDVSAGSFYPPPKVKSAVITLTPHAAPALSNQPVREKRLFRLIRASFSQRRKTLANAASSGLGLPKPELESALQTAGLQSTIRPEQLTLDDYIRLENAIWSDPF